MAHKTLIGGTAYEIGGGKTLIDGTAFAIDKGKTLVGGTAYEVGFAQPATITLSYVGNGNKPVGAVTSVIIDGVSYPQDKETAGNLPTEEILVPIGTVISCKILVIGSTPIILNNTPVSYSGEYLYTVVGDAKITAKCNMTYTPQTGTTAIGAIEITEL